MIPDNLKPLVEPVREILRARLDAEDFNPGTFREISKIADATHDMLSTLDPVLNVPKIHRAEPLAPAPASETYGATLMRELLQGISAIGGRKSRADLIKAIALAEREGLVEDAKILRADLYGEEKADREAPDETDAAKFSRANGMITEAKRLLAEITPVDVASE